MPEHGRGLYKDVALESLDLSDNMIGKFGAQALAQVLRNNATLKSLDLSGNNIGEHQVSNLTKAWGDRRGVLDLENN